MKNGRSFKKSDVRAMVDEAGQLQQASSSAAKLYKDKRKELCSPLTELFGTEQHVRSATGEYTAILSYDKHGDVDIIEVVNKYVSREIGRDVLRQILSVRVTEARKLLSDALVEELIVDAKDETPTLHISVSEKSE